MMKEQVIEEIKQLCGKVMILNNGWCYFVYHHIHFVNIPDDDMIRISIPHIASCNDYAREVLDKAINETNREVKFIKAMVLNNGSISMDYDHKVIEGECIPVLVQHMVTVLYVASGYLMKKLNPQKNDRHGYV